MNGEPLQEDTLIEQARVLIDRGFKLHDMNSLKELEHWDLAVNSLLQDINTRMAGGEFRSPRLERYLKQLIELYLTVIREIARLDDNKADQAAQLHQKRWAITG